jgi:putative ATPase
MRSPRLSASPATLADKAYPLLAKNGNFVLLSSPPCLGERISRILADQCERQDLASLLEQAEETFFENTTGAGLWNSAEIETAFTERKFSVKLQTINQKEERLITDKDFTSWFNTDQSRWGSFMVKNLEKTVFSEVKEALSLRIVKGPVLWQWKSILLTAEK